MKHVVQIPDQAARLKRKIRAHFKQLGFVKAPDGMLLPPGFEKQDYRDMHSHQRSDRLVKNEEWLSVHAQPLLQHFASGCELDVARIRPRIEVVATGTWQAHLFRLATYYWRIPISEGYGRRMRFLVWDDHHKKLIGLFALGDAVFNLRARDEFIGWDHVRRQEALVNLMDAYALGAVPPYNKLLGGKVVASLVRTREVAEHFKEKYHDTQGVISGKRKNAVLAAVTTTSALGRSSLYNRLKLDGTQIFERIGQTSGWGHFHVSNELFADMRQFLCSIGDAYGETHEYGQGPNFRLRLIRRVFALLGMDPDLARHGLKREVFFSPFASNAKEFLCGEHPEADLSKLPSAGEIGAAAVVRWVVPRADRVPEFREWSRSSFLDELQSASTINARIAAG